MEGFGVTRLIGDPMEQVMVILKRNVEIIPLFWGWQRSRVNEIADMGKGFWKIMLEKLTTIPGQDKKFDGAPNAPSSYAIQRYQLQPNRSDFYWVERCEHREHKPTFHKWRRHPSNTDGQMGCGQAWLADSGWYVPRQHPSQGCNGWRGPRRSG